MSKLKYPGTQGMRLSRECLNILDEISEELGSCSRRVAVELLTRFAKRVTDAEGIGFSSLLLKDRTTDTSMQDLDRRRKVPAPAVGASLR